MVEVAATVGEAAHSASQGVDSVQRDTSITTRTEGPPMITATGPGQDHPPALRQGGEATEVTKAVVIMTGGGRLQTSTGLQTAIAGVSVTAAGTRDPDLQTIIDTIEGRDPPPQHDTLDRRPLTQHDGQDRDLPRSIRDRGGAEAV
jgi:hypothetical protein